MEVPARLLPLPLGGEGWGEGAVLASQVHGERVSECRGPGSAPNRSMEPESVFNRRPRLRAGKRFFDVRGA